MTKTGEREAGSKEDMLLVSVRRMALAVEEHSLPRTHFEEVGSEFRVTFMGPSERFMAEAGEFPVWRKG